MSKDNWVNSTLCIPWPPKPHWRPPKNWFVTWGPYMGRQKGPIYSSTDNWRLLSFVDGPLQKSLSLGPHKWANRRSPLAFSTTSKSSVSNYQSCVILNYYLHRRPCICLDLFCLDLFLPVLRAPTKFNFQKYSALRDPSLCFGLDRGIKPAEHGKMIRFYMVRRFSRITSLSSAVMTMRVDFFEVGERRSAPSL